MFGTVANACMWLWTTVGVAAELLFQVIPAALGWTDTVDVGLARTLFSWTLHAIVYFWLFPGLYRLLHDGAAGGRRASLQRHHGPAQLRAAAASTACRSACTICSWIPEQSTGFKFLQSLLTALVTVPTLLTVFTISASLEIAGRLRGGTGLLRLDRRPALGPADGAGDRPLASSCSGSAAAAA